MAYICCLGVSNAAPQQAAVPVCFMHQLQSWLLHSLSLHTQTGSSCLLQAHLLVLPLVLDKIHASVIHDWCGKSAQGRFQILMAPGAVQTKGDESCPTVFPTYCACNSFSNTFCSLSGQEILSTCFAFLVCSTYFPSKHRNSSCHRSGVGLDPYLSEPLLAKVSKCLLEGSSPSPTLQCFPTP